MYSYKEIVPIEKAVAEKIFASNDVELICSSLVSISFYEQDWKWAQNICIEFIENKDLTFKGIAATCLGHIARVQGKLEKEKELIKQLELISFPPYALPVVVSGN